MARGDGRARAWGAGVHTGYIARGGLGSRVTSKISYIVTVRTFPLLTSRAMTVGGLARWLEPCWMGSLAELRAAAAQSGP